MDKIKFLKNDAIVDIKIGAGFLQKLQRTLLYLVKDLTPEQLAQYKKESEEHKENPQFSQEWMEHVTVMSVLLKEVETKAEEQGLTYEEDEVTPTES